MMRKELDRWTVVGMGSATAILLGSLLPLLQNGSALAGTAALQPFGRKDVIPAPGVDFVRVGDLDGDDRIDFVGLDGVYDRGTGVITEVRLKWWRQEAPAAGEPLGSEFSDDIEVRGASRDPDLKLGVGDFDGDGNPDLLTVEPNGQVSAWLNVDGSADYPQRRSGGRVQSGAGYIEVANLDADSGDTHDDLLVLRDGRDVTWYPGQGAAGEIDLGSGEVLLRGSDTSKVVVVTTGDIDGDGLLDLATATDKTGDSIAWWHQRIEGEDRVFERAGEGDEPDVRDLTMGDIDGDGDLDILVTSQDGTRPYKVFAWLNTGDGVAFERDETSLHTSATKDHKWNAIDAADVNGDGAIDFITSELTEGRTNGVLCWYENPGAPAPTEAPSATPTPPDPTATVNLPDPTRTPSPEPGPSDTPVTSPSATPGEDPEAIIYLPFALKP